MLGNLLQNATDTQYSEDIAQTHKVPAYIDGGIGMSLIPLHGPDPEGTNHIFTYWEPVNVKAPIAPQLPGLQLTLPSMPEVQFEPTPMRGSDFYLPFYGPMGGAKDPMVTNIIFILIQMEWPHAFRLIASYLNIVSLSLKILREFTPTGSASAACRCMQEKLLQQNNPQIPYDKTIRRRVPQP